MHGSSFRSCTHQRTRLLFAPRRPLSLSHGSTYRFSVLAGRELGCARSVDVGWSYRGSLMDPRTLCTWWTDCNSALHVRGLRLAGTDNPYK